MIKFFTVSPAIWNKRTLDLGRDTALAYCYVLTTPHRLSEGLFRLPKTYMATDLNYSLEEVEQCLKALESEGLIAYDDDAEVLFDPQALVVNPPNGDKRIQGTIKKLRQVPRTRLLRELWKSAFAHCEDLARAIEEAFPEALESSTDTPSEQYPDLDGSSGVRDQRVDKGEWSPEGVESPEDIASEFEGEVVAWGAAR